MAKTVDLAELYKRFKAGQLTTPQMARLLEELRALRRGRGVQLPDPTPGHLAQRLSRDGWEMAPHLEVLSAYLADLEAGRRRRLLVSMPPRHGKSCLTSEWFPLWLLARNPRRRIILTSYEADYAATFGRKVRNHILAHDRELGLLLDSSSTAAHRWELTTGGGMVTAGAGGPITGRGADALIIDDPIKNEEEAASEVLREKLWDWFMTTAMTRLEPGGFVVVIQTRWHQDDLAGRLERQSESGEGLRWDVLRFPALAEEGDSLGRAVGEALWPKRFDTAALLEKKKGTTPYFFSALYQQRPTPEEGGAVQRRWWKFYQVPPAKFDKICQSWDLAVKDLKKGSYTVGQVWGRKGAELFLLDQVRDHMNMPEALTAFRNLSLKYPTGLAKLVEDKANGPAMIAMLSKEIPGIIPWPPRGTKMQSKDARLSAVIPAIQAGNVYLPHPEIAPWVADYIEEHAAFPMGTHDDQIDATTQAMTYLLPASWQTIRRDFQEARDSVGAASSTREIMARAFDKHVKKVLKRVDRNFKREQQGSLFRPRRVRAW